MLKLEV